MKYCPQCGRELEDMSIDGTIRKACGSPTCDFVFWDNPVPVVMALVELEGTIILARNAKWPQGVFSLISGFVERRETPERAVLREVEEELGLRGSALRFIGYYPFAARNQLILAFGVTATGALRAGPEIAELRVVSRKQLRDWDFGRLTLTAKIVASWLNQDQVCS